MNRAVKSIMVIVSVLTIPVFLLLVGFIIFSIVGHYDFTRTEDGRMCFGVSKVRRDVFCISCEWDGGETSYTVPNEFMGYPVTTLGGYTGRGYPCPFGVRISRDAISYDTGWDERGYEVWHREGDEYEILTFSVHIGANVKEFNGVMGKQYLVNRIEREDEEYEGDVLYKVVYYFTVDERNKTFYAENGKLFYHESGQEVSDFFYA